MDQDQQEYQQYLEYLKHTQAPAQPSPEKGLFRRGMDTLASAATGVNDSIESLLPADEKFDKAKEQRQQEAAPMLAEHPIAYGVGKAALPGAAGLFAGTKAAQAVAPAVMAVAPSIKQIMGGGLGGLGGYLAGKLLNK